MIQEIKVNQYLYDFGYTGVKEVLETSLEAYAGEKYAILDVENIYFYHHINYELTTDEDPNLENNYTYKNDRNETLKKGLEYAEELFEKVNNKKLYSKRKAKKIR